MSSIAFEWVNTPVYIVNQDTLDFLAASNHENSLSGRVWALGQPQLIPDLNGAVRTHYPLLQQYQDGDEGNYGTVRLEGLDTSVVGPTVVFYDTALYEFDPLHTGRWFLVKASNNDTLGGDDIQLLIEGKGRGGAVRAPMRFLLDVIDFTASGLQKIGGVFVGLFKLLDRIVRVPSTKEEHLQLILWLKEGLQLLRVQDRVSGGALISSFEQLTRHLVSQHSSNLPNLTNKPGDSQPIGTPIGVVDVDCIAYENIVVSNWGQNVTHKAALLFLPESTFHIQQIINYARLHHKSIRCIGYATTASEIYHDDDQIVIAFRSPEARTASSPLNAAQIELNGELHQIGPLNTTEFDTHYGLIRCGAGARNADLLRACHKSSLRYALPFNDHMPETTFGGLSSMIAHGTGHDATAISDLIYQVELVDYDGNIRIYSRGDSLTDRHNNRLNNSKFYQTGCETSDLMDTISGGFGLFGVITHITFKMPKMRTASFSPYKGDLYDVIPSPHSSDGLNGDAESMLSPAAVKYVNHMNELRKNLQKSHTEFTWYPYHSNVYVNCFDTSPIQFNLLNQDAVEALYEQNVVTHSDRFYTIMASIHSSLLRGIDHSCSTCIELLSHFLSSTLPVYPQLFDTVSHPHHCQGTHQIESDLSNPEHTSQQQQHEAKCHTEAKQVIATEAHHFRRSLLHPSPTRNFEVLLSLPSPTPDGLDQNAIDMLRELWWAAIGLVLKYQEEKLGTPLSAFFTLKLTGGSNTTMSPQYHNARTAALEVASYSGVDGGLWDKFCVELWSRWDLIRTKYNSTPLLSTPTSHQDNNESTKPVQTSSPKAIVMRPNWAKEWAMLTSVSPTDTTGDQPKINLKALYCDQIDLFMKHLEKYSSLDIDLPATRRSPEDYLKLFGNQTFRELFQSGENDDNTISTTKGGE